MTVAECAKQLVKAFGFEGEEWHLCTSNGFGEADKQIATPSATLREAHIENNDLLILESGKLLPKVVVFSLNPYPLNRLGPCHGNCLC